MQIAAATAVKPRIVFYLPAVIPWWFTNIIAPMIRAAMRGGEVHVLVPPFWSSTGIRPEDLIGCEDLDVTWHILDQDDHPELRFAKMHDGVVELVRQIDPVLCLCRSADNVTPSAFPGVVRYIMEAHADPFGTPYWNVQLCEDLFDHGMIPAIGAARGQWLEGALAEQWDRKMAAYPAMGHADFLQQAAIPSGKLLLGLPLDFEHEEVFWDQHFPHPTNIDLVNAVANQLDDDVMLLITHHPLNAQNLTPDFVALNKLVRQRLDKIRIVHDLSGPRSATKHMLRHCDGMIFGISKCFTTAAFLGKPMLRISKFATGDWLDAYSDLPEFVDALRTGTARAPSRADAQRWFAFHHANTIIDPVSPDLDVQGLLDYAVNPVNPARWERGLARYLGVEASLPPMPADVDQPALRAA